MQRLKVVFVALMAVFALSAVMASAASAIENPFVLPEAAQPFTGTSGPGTLSTLSGKEVSCKSDTSQGTFAANGREGTLHIDFEGCTSEKGAVVCTGLGEKSGIILALGTFLLVYDALGTVAEKTLGVAILVTLEEVHFSCSIILVNVKGLVLCLVTPVEVNTKTLTITCEQKSNGDPKETIYWENGKETKMGEEKLLTAFNHGTFEMSAEKTEGTVTPEKLVTVHG